MMATTLELLSWHWFVAGVLLIILEMLAPMGHTLWLGISALIVGAILWLFPEMGWKFQMLIFAVLSIASVILYKHFASKNVTETDSPDLNRGGERYVGRVFTIDEPIVNGIGKIKVEDSTWRVNGSDLPAGATVKVVAVDGSTLQVEAN